jgi:hypothetical protein
MKKVLSNGPKKVANRGQKAMGTKLGPGAKQTPKGSDSSRAKVQPATRKAPAKATKFSPVKYERMRKNVFQLEKNEDKGII